MSNAEEKKIIEAIAKNDEKAFEELFKRYYSYLCVFASKIIHDDISAEEIVQDFFVKFWEKRNSIQIDNSVKNYLFRSVKNLCLNHIKHNKIRLRHAQQILAENEEQIFDNNFVEVDLSQKIEECIAALPEKRREIFRLNREEGLKYREIAEKLNISIKTVETQMGLAIKTLRDKLKKYYTFIFFILQNK